MAASTEQERPVWAGWVPQPEVPTLPLAAVRLLAEELGVTGRGSRRVAVEQAQVGPGRLDEVALLDARALLGQEGVCTDDATRARHAGGRSYLDLLARRSGAAGQAPDAVLRPADHAAVVEVLSWAARHGVACVPFGGGTSVVGGLEPLLGTLRAVVALDLRRLDRLESIDLVSRTATFGAGVTGPQAEAALEPHGLTLGHLPQSFEQATIGGFVATRSAGQASAGYGRVDDMLVALRCATPKGELQLRHGSATAAGPDLLHLLAGSEGAFGVITSATLRVRPKPAERRYEGWFFRSVAEGMDALRVLAQDGPESGATAEVIRLSDEEETRVSLAMSSASALQRRALDAYLGAVHRRGGCLAVIGWEGSSRSVARRSTATAELLRRAGGACAGQRIGRSWEKGRFGGPRLRDALLDRGVLVETLETAAPWSELGQLHGQLRAALTTALAAQGTPPVVMAHVSHTYPEAASLYVTVLARADADDPAGQWRLAKEAACEVLVRCGATITHHHAVGADHAPYLAAEVGELGVEVIRAVKACLDPAGLMNPGTLLPS